LYFYYLEELLNEELEDRSGPTPKVFNLERIIRYLRDEKRN